MLQRTRLAAPAIRFPSLRSATAPRSGFARSSEHYSRIRSANLCRGTDASSHRECIVIIFDVTVHTSVTNSLTYHAVQGVHSEPPLSANQNHWCGSIFNQECSLMSQPEALTAADRKARRNRFCRGGSVRGRQVGSRTPVLGPGVSAGAARVARSQGLPVVGVEGTRIVLYSEHLYSRPQGP